MFERLRRLFGSRQPETVMFLNTQHPYELRFEHTTDGLKRKTVINNHAVNVEASSTGRVWLSVSTSFSEIRAPLLPEDCRHLAKVLHEFSKKAVEHAASESDHDLVPVSKGRCHKQRDLS